MQLRGFLNASFWGVKVLYNKKSVGLNGTAREGSEEKNRKKTRKKTLKKKRSKKNNRQNKQPKAIDLQKVIGFKFQSLSKVYDNFRKKRETEKLKQDKLKSKKQRKNKLERNKRN